MSIPEAGDALADTNLLTAYTDVDHAKHGMVVQFINETDFDLVVAPQSLYEYWAVATRPKGVNGLNLTPEVTWWNIVQLRRAFTILPDPPGLLDEWLDLCRTHDVSGKPAHDARLAAYARLLGIRTLVTLNARDFGRYGLNVVVP